jgi:hypothetical protein
VYFLFEKIEELYMSSTKIDEIRYESDALDITYKLGSKFRDLLKNRAREIDVSQGSVVVTAAHVKLAFRALLEEIPRDIPEAKFSSDELDLVFREYFPVNN